MEVGKGENMPELTNNKDKLGFIIGATLIVITGIICLTFYNYFQTLAIKSNIESAIVKGIDPVAVKCAYSSGDVMCVAYAVAHGQGNTPKK
jgi:CDP-diglyceride synthetase